MNAGELVLAVGLLIERGEIDVSDRVILDVGLYVTGVEARKDDGGDRVLVVEVHGS